MKIKTITLTYIPEWIAGHDGGRWKIDQVTDSLEFNPGSLLRKDQVDSLCGDPAWKVVVKPLKD